MRGVEDISSSADPMTTTVPSNSPIGGVSRSSSTLLMKEMVDRLELGQDESEGGDILTLLKSPHGARGHTHDPTTQYDDTVSPLGMGDVSTGALTPHDLTDMISNADGLPIAPTSDMTSIKFYGPYCSTSCRLIHSNTAFPTILAQWRRDRDPAAEQEMDLHIKAAAGVPQETEKDKGTFQRHCKCAINYTIRLLPALCRISHRCLMRAGRRPLTRAASHHQEGKKVHLPQVSRQGRPTNVPQEWL